MNHNSREQMKYIEITEAGGPEVLKVVQGEKPEIKEDEVLIEVYATGINRPDILQRQGLYPMPKGVTLIPGLEVAGVIVEIGSKVEKFKVGDKVCALTNGGGYAEYCAVPANQTLTMPKNLSFVEAAAIPETYFTVWANLFQIGHLKKNETVLIHGGASGIGSTAISLCHAMGIQSYSTVGHDDKVEKLASMSNVINYKAQDFEKEVLALTDGKGVDVILDIIGAAYFNQNLRLLKRDGRLVIIGFMGGRKVDDFDIQELMLKRAVVTGSTMRARTNDEKAKITRELEQFVWPLIEAGQCKPIIYKTFAFEDVAQAHQCLESSQHLGKVVLELKS
ncbi:Phthiocerol synthesis polyketide synthase type I PpsC [Acinetobacter venetianus]|uniref:Phthiocerol synthesis polyketide synthase type I PpsC n=1 Tax=Acinetobacter venetianus TaxID=52133 RepID=A0A150HTN3_9GAMM|nr:NAD(P)H-quinone oxidoreductase [Acinetobacter venetianus]KXZ69784.1 Phthiocerol synthesis polyketide synthase type I PpsC [Acinetobacter venetianus]